MRFGIKYKIINVFNLERRQVFKCFDVKLESLSKISHHKPIKTDLKLKLSQSLDVKSDHGCNAYVKMKLKS